MSVKYGFMKTGLFLSVILSKAIVMALVSITIGSLILKPETTGIAILLRDLGLFLATQNMKLIVMKYGIRHGIIMIAYG